MSALYTYIDYWSVSRQNHQKPKVAVQQYNPFQEESFTHLSGILRRMPVELSSVALVCPKLALFFLLVEYMNRKQRENHQQIAWARLKRLMLAIYGLYLVSLVTSSWMGVVSQF